MRRYTRCELASKDGKISKYIYEVLSRLQKYKYFTFYRLKNATENNIKLELYQNKPELYINGELLDSSHDRKTLAQVTLRDKGVIVAKVCNHGI